MKERGMDKEIPIIYSYIYYRLKKDLRISMINLSYLKEIIGRCVVRRRGGFPRMFIKYVISDLVNMDLLKKINYNTYEVLENDCDKKIKRMYPFY